MLYDDSAKIVTTGVNIVVLTKVRAVRKDNIVYLDVYNSNTILNETEFFINIPFKASITSARCIDTNLVQETSDSEKVVCSVNLTNSLSK